MKDLLWGSNTEPEDCSQIGGNLKKCPQKCDIVVKKLISYDLIYFYLTPNISVVAF